MKNYINSIRSSALELGNVSTLAVCGMLLALKIVLGLFTVNVSELLKIGFSFLPIAVAGMLFGPVVGGVVGAAGDVFSYLVQPAGPYFPGFTLNAFLSGFLSGLFLYRKPIRFGRVLASKASVTVLVSMALNPLWLSVLYGKAFWAVFSARIAANLAELPVDAVLLFVVLRLVRRIRVRGWER